VSYYIVLLSNTRQFYFAVAQWISSLTCKCNPNFLIYQFLVILDSQEQYVFQASTVQYVNVIYVANCVYLYLHINVTIYEFNFHVRLCEKIIVLYDIGSCHLSGKRSSK
jgi:hypothetical protein